MLQKYSFLSVVKKTCLLFIFASLFFSCDKFDSEQSIPSYIYIDKIILVDNPIINEGSLSNKITDAWVYVDYELIGAFELPATIPVLKKGKHIITIYPGIKMNGISGTRVQYDFYKQIDITDFNFVEDSIRKIDTLLTKTMYKDNLKIWEEDFDDVSIKFEKRANSDTTIIQSLALANSFDGSPYGIVSIDAAHTVFEVETKGDHFVLPKSSSPVYLEMNYKTNNSVIIGLLAYSSTTTTTPTAQISTISLKPGTEWKKIYINFTPDISDYYNSNSFKVFIAAYKDTGNPTAEILFDNIKLIHFNPSK